MFSNVACLFFFTGFFFHWTLLDITGHYWTLLDITGHCHIKIFDFLSYLSSLMSNDSPDVQLAKLVIYTTESEL